MIIYDNLPESDTKVNLSIKLTVLLQDRYLFRYKEWIASRIKIKEDKKKNKKKGRLSELQGKDGDVSMESDRSMAETETDVSMAAG